MSKTNSNNQSFITTPVEATIYINPQGTKASIIYPNYGIKISTETNSTVLPS